MKDLVILYVEDEETTRENTYELLSIMFDNVHVAKDGQEGLELYNKCNPDIIIADIEMEFLTGLELAEKVRQTNKTVQIILTTAYTDTKYFLKAVELNLVKYLVKPVILDELENAINKAKENLNSISKVQILISDGLIFDFENRELKYLNKKVDLSYQELLFLELLLKYPNHSVSYEMIENAVWDFEDHIMSITALRTLVKKLRKKLPEGIIQNSSKLGYRIVTLEK